MPKIFCLLLLLLLSSCAPSSQKWMAAHFDTGHGEAFLSSHEYQGAEQLRQRLRVESGGDEVQFEAVLAKEADTITLIGFGTFGNRGLTLILEDRTLQVRSTPILKLPCDPSSFFLAYQLLLWSRESVLSSLNEGGFDVVVRSDGESKSYEVKKGQSMLARLQFEAKKSQAVLRPDESACLVEVR